MNYRFLILFLAILTIGCQNRTIPFIGNTSKKDARFKIRTDGKTGYINSSGQVIVPAIYDYGHDFSDGLALIEQDYKVGYLKPDGKWLMEPQFGLSSGSFSEDRAAVQVLDEGSISKGSMGYIDEEGKLIIPDVYEKAKAFSEGLAAVRKGGLWGFVDKLGILVIDPTFKSVGSFSGNLCKAVNQDGRSGYIDRTGNWSIPPAFREAMPFKEGFACVNVQVDDWNYDWAVIDETGSYHIKPGGIANSNSSNPEYSEGLLCAIDPISGRYGYLDLDGQWKIKPKFEEARPFSEGYAAAKNAAGWAFIDDKGVIKIPVIGALDLDPFVQGLAAVQDRNGNWSNYINTKGQYVYQSR